MTVRDQHDDEEGFSSDLRREHAGPLPGGRVEGDPVIRADDQLAPAAVHIQSLSVRAGEVPLHRRHLSGRPPAYAGQCRGRSARTAS